MMHHELRLRTARYRHGNEQATNQRKHEASLKIGGKAL